MEGGGEVSEKTGSKETRPSLSAAGSSAAHGHGEEGPGAICARETVSWETDGWTGTPSG